MDGLALLCNLFADGPVTLKRLRSAGVDTLSELERTPPARLAEWLHASVPQADAFAGEARKLARRLSEDARPAATHERSGNAGAASGAAPARVPEPPRSASRQAPPPAPAPIVSLARGAAPAAAEPLRAGLLPGLDESLCARLALHHVRTLQALSELAGLALARRTGIPYSTLLDLSRAARRLATERARDARSAARPVLEEAPRVEPAVELREHELRPHVQRDQPDAHLRDAGLLLGQPDLDLRPARAPAERELARSDEFTLPAAEPESAGPFG